MNASQIRSFLYKSFRLFLIGLGAIFFLILILSFTTLPFWGYYWLGTSKSGIKEKPEYIVMLGGGGMPSESNLMRAYFVFKAAIHYPDSKIVISIPGDTLDEYSTVSLVANELIQKGIDRHRIVFENVGTNTRMEALCLLQICGGILKEKSILLVTSPEHMRRSVLTFRRAGFKNVNTLPAFENSLEANLGYRSKMLGGRRIPLPDVGNSITVRYQFWNHLKYEILVARELTALGYYWLRGWI
jgi:uncharacterized SAM-binding protein YcdF (DUF218 family)